MIPLENPIREPFTHKHLVLLCKRFSDNAREEKTMALKKTNAARILDELHLEYELRGIPADEVEELSATAMANTLGVPPEEVFKTLVARGDKNGVVMACIPAEAELNLKALAQVSGNKNVHMVPLKEVLPLTGYMRGGCSPIGAKKAYPVFIDESAQLFERIFVSAGQRGLQLHLAPESLVKAVNATYADLCKE